MTTPAATPIAEGAAFPWSMRLFGGAMVAGMLWQGALALPALRQADWSPAALALTVAALVLVLWCLSWIFRSRTAVDATGVRQTWIWTKQVQWADVAQARILAVPGLEWLVVPRLVVRVRGGGLMAFHTADRAVLQAFALFVATGAPPVRAEPTSAHP